MSGFMSSNDNVEVQDGWTILTLVAFLMSFDQVMKNRGYLRNQVPQRSKQSLFSSVLFKSVSCLKCSFAIPPI